MKKGAAVLLMVFICGICMVIGIFIGRSHRKEFQPLGSNQFIQPADMPQVTTNPKMDLNTASKAQLMDIPGIGEELADRIIQYRSDNGPFESISELLNVEGIGEQKLLAIEARLNIGG